MWVHVPLDLSSPEKIAQAFSEVASNKPVTKKDAVALGFDLSSLDECIDDTSKVIVPSWRHALISFEHPLLRQGLRIIDTPGLNALGCEPELTFSLLPEAHAVLFMLSSDTGVTSTDMKIWNDHIRGLAGHINSGMYAVLNKIDMLWDDPDCENGEDIYINEIREKTALTLGIPKEGIIPLSAKMGLLAKLRGDEELLEKSHLPKLEQLLSDSIVSGKESAIQESIVNDVLNLLHNTRSSLRNRLTEINTHKIELSTDLSSNHSKFKKLNEKTKKEQSYYHKRLLLLKSSHRIMQRKAPELLDPILESKLDNYLNNLQHDLAKSWTRKGVSKATQHFFQSIESDLQLLKQKVRDAENVVADTYANYESEQILSSLIYPRLNINKHIHQLSNLQINASRYSTSLMDKFSERSFVPKKFFSTLSDETRSLYKKTFEETKNWCKSALSPILQHAQEQKKMLDTQLIEIRSLAKNGSTAKEQVQKLGSMSKKLERQMEQIDAISKALRTPAPTTKAQKVVPLATRLVPEC